VDIVVDDENRTVAEQSGQHRVRLTGVIHRRITGEHRLDVSRVGEIDQRPDRGDPQREDVAVAASAGGDDPRPVAQHEHRLDRGRQGRARR
jgi:hypothetical protein